MRTLLKRAGRRLAVGWFWPLVLAALPSCGFHSQAGVVPPNPNLNPGPAPHTSTVFCDIEKPADPSNLAAPRACATDAEIATGVRLTAAALALNTGSTSPVGLDYAAAALARCGGKPEAVHFFGTFPEGFSVCVNCGNETVRSNPPADNNAVCAAQCEDFFGTTDATGTLFPANPPDPAVQAFCEQRAHAATNFPLTGCFDNACTIGGALDPAFVDPRRAPEPVAWRDLIRTSVVGTTLTRTAPSDGVWDSGAASTQSIDRGDAYVEFGAIERTTRRLAGLSTGTGPDTDPNFTAIGFGIGLIDDGNVFVFESGVARGPFGAYADGDRFRVSASDNLDGTATIRYSRVMGACHPGTPCNEQVFFTSTAKAQYPFRVDTAFFQQNGTLADVRLVRIH